MGHWSGVGGCESGFAIPDTAANNEVWSGCYDGGLEYLDPATGHARNVRVWPEAAYGWRPADLRYRWHWTFPVVVSPHDNNTVYVGSQHVHRTRDKGSSWEVISPDLTLNDKSKQQSSGGMTTDNLMTFDGSVLYALAESPREDAFRAPMKLYGRTSALGSDVGRFGADFAPTAQQQEVYELLEERFEEAKRLMDTLLEEDLQALNERLRARRLPVISD